MKINGQLLKDALIAVITAVIAVLTTLGVVSCATHLEGEKIKYHNEIFNKNHSQPVSDTLWLAEP